MKPKDPLPTLDKSDAVYRIPCKDCTKNYIGETAKRVGTRIHEHQLAIKRGESYSQLWTHMMETGHNFDLMDVRVVSTCNTKCGRLLKEAWFSNEESINRHIDLCQAHQVLKTWEDRNRRIPNTSLPPLPSHFPTHAPLSLVGNEYNHTTSVHGRPTPPVPPLDQQDGLDSPHYVHPAGVRLLTPPLGGSIEDLAAPPFPPPLALPNTTNTDGPRSTIKDSKVLDSFKGNPSAAKFKNKKSQKDPYHPRTPPLHLPDDNLSTELREGSTNDVNTPCMASHSICDPNIPALPPQINHLTLHVEKENKIETLLPGSITNGHAGDITSGIHFDCGLDDHNWRSPHLTLVTTSPDLAPSPLLPRTMKRLQYGRYASSSPHPLNDAERLPSTRRWTRSMTRRCQGFTTELTSAHPFAHTTGTNPAIPASTPSSNTSLSISEEHENLRSETTPMGSVMGSSRKPYRNPELEPASFPPPLPDATPHLLTADSTKESAKIDKFPSPLSLRTVLTVRGSNSRKEGERSDNFPPLFLRTVPTAGGSNLFSPLERTGETRLGGVGDGGDSSPVAHLTRSPVCGSEPDAPLIGDHRRSNEARLNDGVMTKCAPDQPAAKPSSNRHDGANCRNNHDSSQSTIGRTHPRTRAWCRANGYNIL